MATFESIDEDISLIVVCNWIDKVLFEPLDVQKFPLRMKDNDLLVTELYRDPTEDAITALSVYLTPKTSTYYLLLLLLSYYYYSYYCDWYY